MESHPEQYSDGMRLSIQKEIFSKYSQIGYDIYELALGLLDVRPKDDVLDVGCGFGEFLIKMRKSGHYGKLVGIDFSDEMIKEARGISRAQKVSVDFRIGNLNALEFPSASFDYVTAFHVMGKICPESTLLEIGRLMKVDGTIVISTDSRTCFPALAELRNKARKRFGWCLPSESHEEFTSEDAPEKLRIFFGGVEEFRYEDVVQYPDAEVLVNLFKATPGLKNEGLSEDQWDRIVDWVRDQAIELIPEHSYAEDPRSFSLFRCTNPLGL